MEIEVRWHQCERRCEAKRLPDENARLRKLVADLILDKEALPQEQRTAIDPRVVQLAARLRY